MRRAPQDAVLISGVGGTSTLWSGRCGGARPHRLHRTVLGAQQRLADRPRRRLAPHLPAAGVLLGLGPSRYGGVAVDRIDPPVSSPAWTVAAAAAGVPGQRGRPCRR